MSDNRPVDTTPAPAPSAPTLPGLGGDWPAQAADKIVQVVGQVRDRTTGPAITVARGAVYGLLAGILGAVCLVLFIICLVRLLDTYVVAHGGGDPRSVRRGGGKDLSTHLSTVKGHVPGSMTLAP